MGIAEEHSLGKVLIHEGRIGFRLFEQLVLIHRLLRQRRGARQEDERCGKSEQVADYTM